MNDYNTAEFLRQQAIEAKENRFLHAKSVMLRTVIGLLVGFFVGMWAVAYFWESLTQALATAGILTLIISVIISIILLMIRSDMKLRDYDE